MFVGLPRIVNASQVLHRFNLYRKAQYNGLFNVGKVSQNGFLVYILNDKKAYLKYTILSTRTKHCRHVSNEGNDEQAIKHLIQGQ
jgi:hypothetical protein